MHSKEIKYESTSYRDSLHPEWCFMLVCFCQWWSVPLLCMECPISWHVDYWN